MQAPVALYSIILACGCVEGTQGRESFLRRILFLLFVATVVVMMLAVTAGAALAAPTAGSGGLIRFGPHHFKPGDCGHRDGIEGSPEEIVAIGNYPPTLLNAPPGNVQKICFIPTTPP
jgi:hypothetical protein